MGPGIHGSAEPGTEARAAEAAPETSAEAALWSGLSSAQTLAAFCQNWLAIQCRQIRDVSGGLVLLTAEARGTYAPVAVWPDVRRDMSYLTMAAQRALAERRGLVARGGEAAAGGCHVAYPLEARDTLHGVVVLDVAPRPERELQAVLRHLHWGAAQVELMLYRLEVDREAAGRGRLQTVLDLMASSLGHERFEAAATAFVNATANRLDCDRVTLGFVRGGQVRIEAVSHNAQFRERTNLLRGIAEAMDEAIDQRTLIAVPAGGGPAVTRAHEALAESQESECVLTVPLGSAENPTGALTLERTEGRPFDDDTIELVQALAAVAGPPLETHWREDQWLPTKIANWGRLKLSQLVGPRHVGLKLGTGLTLALLAFLIFAKGDYRASARTVLEPRVQTAAVAPFNGFIREAPARAGDVVREGAVLAVLDDRDLRLERLKWLAQEDELLKQYRQAMAERNAAQVEVYSAQLAQSRAQLALVDDQLARTQIRAPFDGVVVSGDLSQQLGAPVERGTLLYEIAPLNAYRVILQVDERDIPDVTAGQTGRLLLSAFPHEPIGFTVEKVTPVATASEGRNYFRAEAKLEHDDPRLRPGMEGVGKVDIDRRRFVWIWTHQIIDWLRLKLWAWLP
jgi:biotin carboxyl carrier protein